MIRTQKAKASERLLVAEDDGRCGIIIRRAIRDLLYAHQPFVIAQEANTGSKSAKAAKQLARAQQACLDPIDEWMDAMPLMFTPQAVKKKTAGSMNASKDLVEKAVRNHWKQVDFEELLAGIAPKKRENAFDALAVAYTAWDTPYVASLRKIAEAA